MSKTGPKTEAGLEAVSENGKSLDHSAWTRNPEAVQAIEVAKRLRQTKHGMYASVPIICKAELCPYAGSCDLFQVDMAPYGEKCPVEIAAIEDLFQRYCSDMKIDPSDPNQQVDAIMVKEVVDLDVSMLRCDKKMAISADFILEQAVNITEDGDLITRKELHPLTEYKEKLRTQKYKTLNLLNSTRKDKQGASLNIHLDPSEKAAEMISIKEEMNKIMEEEKDAEKQYYERFNRDKIIEVEPIIVEDEE